MADTKEIDFSAKKDEAEWQQELDTFSLHATPKIFEWLRWVTTLAALTYVQQKTKSTAILIFLGIANGLLYLYFMAFFYRFRFKGLPFQKTPRINRFISLILSGLLSFGTWLLVKEAIHAVVSTQS